ncbi:GNAT family N-acetyltransferase [Exiguobacterium mexicanum]|uniref:GNAT family N-acetyltransferase n=1 Tax=Exiguobacterium mexicanum TaxID=340146 RepID=A0ABT7MMC6_9BACL|nr:GNAT family N-acetyltransferase [Exiguobacterium mexicanum]MDL5376349.1 GNAT family N-acetyltransferase [Exiguobacterium mexicanum]
MIEIDKIITFRKMDWDTDYFGLKCAKAVLHNSLSQEEWGYLEERFKDYQFISIVNENSNPKNAQLIGRKTSAFLADTNIQFSKKIAGIDNLDLNVVIHKGLTENKEILEMADFQYSKFIEDPELFKRGGSNVYSQWLSNSFDNTEKIFALHKDETNKINGFVMFSCSSYKSLIELIAVKKDVKSNGIGARLFKAVEFYSLQNHCNEIIVGTQLRNISAINFYNKMGCKQTECHQIYHLWNL